MKDPASQYSNPRMVVTAGATGADIDVMACVVAYAELLNLEGKRAIPVVVGSLTASITPSVLSWGTKYQTDYTADGSENFVLVDISDPEYCPAFVAHNRIVEVYDHRHGREDYWRQRLHTHAHIEMVGSCGTLIWEQFKGRRKEKIISLTSANLLLASIVSNNLAFRSPLTTTRDKAAYADLSAITGLAEDWIAGYFSEQEKILLKNFAQYVRADIKVFKIAESNFAIAQIEMWNASNLLKTNKSELDAIMAEYEPTPWIVNIINISKGFNYLYSKSSRGQEILEEKLGLKFNEGIAVTDDLLMRKYLMKVLRE